MKLLARKPVQIAVLFYLGFLGLYLFNFNFKLSDDNSKWGTFGDFLGGALNPILGIITIVLTYDIIKTQFIENKQSEFKYMFQILFDVIEENKNLISYNRFGKVYKGREALPIINKGIENLYQSLNEVEGSDKNDNFDRAFWSMFESIDGSSATFMKTIHNCFKVIDEYCLDERKSTYSDLVRAQFHTDDLKFLLYNGIASDDFKSLKSRFEKFTILKDLHGNASIDEYLKNRYEINAYVERSKIKYSKPCEVKILDYEISFKKIIKEAKAS